MSQCEKMGSEAENIVPEDERSTSDELDDAVIAADDTGMVRNEAEIVSVEEQEGGT
jgi:hypothetical protein